MKELLKYIFLEDKGVIVASIWPQLVLIPSFIYTGMYFFLFLSAGILSLIWGQRIIEFYKNKQNNK